MGSGLLSPLHVAIVIAAVVLIFGPKRLPEISRSLGRGIRDFKEGVSPVKVDAHAPPPAPAAPPVAPHAPDGEDAAPPV
jgi:sec-independent protein translocase protein TatA